MNRIATCLIASCAISAGATGLSDLEKFIKTVKTGHSEFTQVVTAPPKEGQPARVKTSSGTFDFSRPGRFRFVYKKPFEQTIVADGQTLWLYDVDLNQVTARKQVEVLGSTPAALIASAANLQAIEADFTLSDSGARDGTDWVVARPKSKDSSLQSIRVGFIKGDLAALEILDSFGQQSVLKFSNFQPQAALDAATFQFKPPAGADVIRQ
jgi:outer membrane lipoprotein carrier protein